MPSADPSSSDSSGTVTEKETCASVPDDAAEAGDVGSEDADQFQALDRAPEGWVIQDGYVILAPTQGDAKALAKAATSATLAEDPTYRDDLRPLGDHVASVWVDSARLKPLAGKSGLEDEFFFPYADLVGGTGRTALVLRFTDSAAEVVGRTNLPDAQGSARVSQLGRLPENTMVGFEMTGAGDRAKRAWDAYSKELSSLSDASGDDLSASGDTDATNPDADRPLDMAAEFKKDYGLTMPKDLISVFGTDFMFAAARTGGGTHYAMRATMPAADATHLASVSPKVVKLLDLPAATTTPSGLAWSDNAAYGATIGNGNLGSSDGFHAAVPDIEHASWALYVELGAGLVALQGRRHRSPGDPGYHAEPGREQHQDLRTPHRPLTAAVSTPSSTCGGLSAPQGDSRGAQASTSGGGGSA